MMGSKKRVKVLGKDLEEYWRMRESPVCEAWEIPCNKRQK